MIGSLRRADPADVPAIAALELALFGAQAWSVAAVTEVVTGAGRVVIVASRRTAGPPSSGGCQPSGSSADQVVGYAVTRLAGEVVDLERIGVAPAHQRTGVASDLLRQLRTHADVAGAERMMLEVSAGNRGALACYAAHGYREIDRRRQYYRDGSDALVLEAPLGEESGGR